MKSVGALVLSWQFLKKTLSNIYIVQKIHNSCCQSEVIGLDAKVHPQEDQLPSTLKV